MTIRTMYVRIGLSLSLGLLVLASGLRPVGAAQPKRLGVLTFRGPGEGATRNMVLKAAAAKHYQVVGGLQISKTASKLKVTMDSDDSFQAVAKELGISAYVTGEVSKKKGTLTVRNGADGSVTAEASWTGANPRKLSSAVGKTFWRRLGPAIERAKAPSGAKPAAIVAEAAAPETDADDAAGDEADSGTSRTKSSSKKVAAAEDEEDGAKSRAAKAGKKGADAEDGAGSETVVAAKSEPEDEGAMESEALMVFVGPRALSRSLSYTDDRYRQNAKYNLGAGPELLAVVDFFPAAFSRSGFISNVGLTGTLGYMLPVVTSPAPVGSYKTYSLNWSVGAKVRLPRGLYATVAYGDQRYELVRSANASGIDVPAVDYRYVRAGAGARIHVTPDWTIMANAAYLQCLSLGRIRSAAYFPHATGAAFEAGAAIGYRINSRFEIQGGADIRRYGLKFHVTLAEYMANPNIRVAGGAIDQYLMGWAGLAVVLGGGGAHAASHHADEEESTSGKHDEGDEEKAKDKDASDGEKPAAGSRKKKAAAEDEEEL